MPCLDLDLGLPENSRIDDFHLLEICSSVLMHLSEDDATLSIFEVRYCPGESSILF